MKVEKALPPNYEEIKKVLSPNKHTVFTYGDTIYSPESEKLPIDLIVHEEVHISQQGEFAKEWWNKYLKDPQFRYEQELEAYKAQFQFLKNITKDRNRRFMVAHKMSCDLGGPMYGNCASYSKAFKDIGYAH